MESLEMQSENDPAIRDIVGERTDDEESIQFDYPQIADDAEISGYDGDANHADETVAKSGITGKFSSLLTKGKTNTQSPANKDSGDAQAKNKLVSGFKNLMPFGKSGTAANDLNESSTDTGEGGSGSQDPNSELPGTNSSDIQPKTSFLGGFKNALPFGKSGTAANDLNESSTDAAEEGSGHQDPNSELQGTNSSDIQPKSSFLGGFKNALPFGKSGTAANDLNESSTDRAGEGSGSQDPNNELQGTNSGDIQPKTSFLGGFKNVLPFGKSGTAANDLNESSTDAVEGDSGQQDPNNELQGNKPGGILPKAGLLGGIKNALPFGKSSGPTAPNERLTGLLGGPNGPLATANGTANGPGSPTTPNGTVPPENTDFTIISSGFNNKKTLANGLMDFAFLTANANQLYYAVASKNDGNTRIISIALIAASISLQIGAGILLIFSSYLQAKPIPIDYGNRQNPPISPESAAILYNQRRIRWLNVMDHWTIALVFIIAIVNIFIAAFSTTETTTDTNTDGEVPTDS